MKVDAVFEGGGVRGIAFVGAVQMLEHAGFHWHRLAGTSSGSIVAGMLAAGYNGKELEKIMSQLQLPQLLKKEWIHYVPYLGKNLRLLVKKGIYKGTGLENWLNQHLMHKGIQTFADLPPDRLKVIISNISTQQMMVWPDDLLKIGKEPGEISVAFAIRISCALPFFFEPVPLKLEGQVNWLVDGGVTSNYPIWLFDQPTKPRWPTFGFRVATKGSALNSTMRITHFFSYMKAILATMRDAHDERYVQSMDALRTIFIPTGSIRATQFSLSEEEQHWLIEQGREAAERFLFDWSFPVYQARQEERYRPV